MSFFFLVVGLDIKAAFSKKEGPHILQKRLPIFAALGGMLVPAGIYLLFNLGQMGQAGWAIPTATDIVFALGVLSFLGKKASVPMRTFLMTLAIADDIGAIIVMALFYSQAIHWEFLILSVVLCLGFSGTDKLFNTWKIPLLLGLSLVVWGCLHQSGIHASLAGFFIGICLPTRYHHWGEMLQPWVQSVVLPLFILANAGVSIIGHTQLLSPSVGLGILCGLIVGKPLGILLFSALAIRLKLANRPPLSWAQLLGLGCLGGIGFTMSLLITQLSFQEQALLTSATLAIGLASLSSAAIGLWILSRN